MRLALDILFMLFSHTFTHLLSVPSELSLEMKMPSFNRHQSGPLVFYYNGLIDTYVYFFMSVFFISDIKGIIGYLTVLIAL